ncbi:MAG: RNA polymerase sigma factor [Solirubrobacteraceae bacterium]
MCAQPSACSRDATELYDRLQPQLWRILNANVRAPSGMVEDACQTAWSRFLTAASTITPGTELGWLATTATRQLLHDLHRDRKLFRSLDAVSETVELHRCREPEPAPDSLLEMRERLAEVGRLSHVEQRLLWMRGFGYDRREIAVCNGISERAVERGLARARKRLADRATQA